MIKGFQNTLQNPQFKGFPNLNHQMNNVAYNVSGVINWWNPVWGLNTQTDLAAISEWTDKITGYKWVQSTAANQPRFIAANASFNNYPTVQFQDSARRMNLTGVGITGLSNASYVFVCKYSTLQNANTLLGRQSGTNNYLFLAGTDAPVTGVGGYDGSYRVSTAPENTSAKIVIFTPTALYVNGTLYSFTGSGFLSDFDQLGDILNLTSYALIGDIAEFLVYKGGLSDSQCNMISSSLNSKYAIY